MGVTKEQDVRKKFGKTEAEILVSKTVKFGQWWPASDTHRWIYQYADGAGFDSALGEIWNAVDSKWEGGLGTFVGINTTTGLPSVQNGLVLSDGETTTTGTEDAIVGVGTGTKRIINKGLAALSVVNRSAGSITIKAGTPVYRDTIQVGLGKVTASVPGPITPTSASPYIGFMHSDTTIVAGDFDTVDVVVDILRFTAGGGDAEGKQDKVNGFEDQDDTLIVLDVFDDAGTLKPQARVTSVSGAELVYYVDKTRLTIPAGDTLTGIFDAVESPKEGNAVSIDINGVLVNDEPFIVTNNCAVGFYHWNADDDAFVYSLDQPHGLTWPVSNHLRDHLCLGSLTEQGEENLKLDGFATDPDGTADADFQYTGLSGNYWDEDIRNILGASTVARPVYYVNGAGLPRFHFQGIATGHPADCAIYSDYDTPGGTYGAPHFNTIDPITGFGSLTMLSDGMYMIMQEYRVKGETFNGLAIMGQRAYISQDDARIGCELEQQETRQGWDILREMVHVGSVILQYNSAFTNAYKVRVVEFSSAAEGAHQEYYDARTGRNNVLLFPTKSVEGFEELGIWRATGNANAYYGRWTVNGTDNPLGLAAATSVILNDNAQGGNNLEAEILAVPADAKLEIVGPSGSVVYQLTSAFTASGANNTATVNPALTTVVGTISNNEDCAIYRSVVSEVQGLDDVIGVNPITNKTATWTDGVSAFVASVLGFTARNMASTLISRLTHDGGLYIQNTTAGVMFTQLLDGILSHQDDADSTELDMNDGHLRVNEERVGTNEYTPTVAGDFTPDYDLGNKPKFISPATAYKINAPTNLPTGKAVQMFLVIDNATGVSVTDANDVELIRATDVGVYQVLIDVADDNSITYGSNAPFFRDNVVTLSGDQTIADDKTFTGDTTVAGMVSTLDAVEIAAQGEKAFQTAESIQARTWASVAPKAGYTLDGSNPMQYALDASGDLILKGRLNATGGTVVTSSTTAVASVPVGFRPPVSSWGRMTINTSSGMQVVSAIVSSGGDISFLEEYTSATYSGVNSLIIEGNFIINRA